MWSVRALLLSADAASSEEAGLHPFAYRKAPAFAKNYSPQELRTISKKLVSLYHDARKGRTSFDVALESLILSM